MLRIGDRDQCSTMKVRRVFRFLISWQDEGDRAGGMSCLRWIVRGFAWGPGPFHSCSSAWHRNPPPLALCELSRPRSFRGGFHYHVDQSPPSAQKENRLGKWSRLVHIRTGKGKSWGGEETQRGRKHQKKQSRISWWGTKQHGMVSSLS